MKFIIYRTDGEATLVDLSEQDADEVLESIPDEVKGYLQYVPDDPPSHGYDLEACLWAAIEQCSIKVSIGDLPALEVIADDFSTKHEYAQVAAILINQGGTVTEAMEGRHDVRLFEGTVAEACRDWVDDRMGHWVDTLRCVASAYGAVGPEVPEALRTFLCELAGAVRYQDDSDPFDLGYWSFKFAGQTWTVTREE